ncbi:MAG: hypothetical protein Fur003_2200 [Candidatus Dojkabacteria bacterium]
MTLDTYSIKKCSTNIKQSQVEFPLLLGKNVKREIIINDFKDYGSIAIFGGTGSGKTNFIHSLIYALMTKRESNELQIICIDTKMSNSYTVFDQSQYFPKGVIPDIEHAIEAVLWCTQEMNSRYKTRQKQPAIFLIIDEFSDLMFSNKDIGDMLKKLATNGSFVGMYLIISTSIPSKRVFTEELRLNIPGRVAFRLPNMFDSMYTLEILGAEKLYKSGEMIFRNTNYDYNIFEHLQVPETTIGDLEELIRGG